MPSVHDCAAGGCHAGERMSDTSGTLAVHLVECDSPCKRLERPTCVVLEVGDMLFRGLQGKGLGLSPLRLPKPFAPA